MDFIMEDLANINKNKKIEELERKIKYQTELIKDIERYNPNSGDLSFDYYQLHELEKELEEIKQSE
jgi:hypothetical protein